MLYTALKSITPIITALNIFERFAPLVQTAERYEEITTNDNGNPVGRKVAYPVGWGITGSDCWNKGRYRELIPNSSKKAIGYFEQNGPLQATTTGPKYSFWVYTAPVRLVMWFDIKKLNINDNALTDVIISDKVLAVVNNAIVDKEFAITDSQFQNAKVKVEIDKILPKDKNVFSKYTYDGVEALLFWPFDFIAVDYKLTITVNKNCLQDITFGDAVVCDVVEPG